MGQTRATQENNLPDNLQIFSGGVYPRAQPHAQSLFLFPIVFVRKTIAKSANFTKNANWFEEQRFGNGKCELSAIS